MHLDVCTLLFISTSAILESLVRPGPSFTSGLLALSMENSWGCNGKVNGHINFNKIQYNQECRSSRDIKLPGMQSFNTSLVLIECFDILSILMTTKYHKV